MKTVDVGEFTKYVNTVLVFNGRSKITRTYLIMNLLLHVCRNSWTKVWTILKENIEFIWLLVQFSGPVKGHHKKMCSRSGNGRDIYQRATGKRTKYLFWFLDDLWGNADTRDLNHNKAYNNISCLQQKGLLYFPIYLLLFRFSRQSYWLWQQRKEFFQS